MPQTLFADLPPSKLKRIRKLTEELTDEETALYMFFRLSPDLFCIADTNGMLVKVNPAWTKVLGWSESELLSTPFLKFVHPEDVDRTKMIMGEMAFDDIVRFHNRYKERDGSYAILEWNATAWNNGYCYASARPVPQECLRCQEANDRFGWTQKALGLGNAATKPKSKPPASD